MTLTEFNLSVGQNITGIPGMIEGVNNNLMAGMYGIFLLATITIIFYLIFLRSTGNFNRALLGASFIGMVLALLFRAMSWINDVAMFIVIIILAIAIVSTKMRD